MCGRDFPGGEGEARFVGRGVAGDVHTVEGRRVLGIEPYEVPEGATPGTVEAIEAARRILAEDT